MTRPMHAVRLFCAIALFVSLGRFSAAAQDGKLKLRVTPHQAYVFVDGHAVSEATKSRNLKLSAGTHKVELVNYGYTSETREVTITAGESTELEVSLTPVSSNVSGPFGAITIEGASRKA